MKIKRLRTLALETFKALNSLKPNFMKDIFNFSPYNTHRKHISVPCRNTLNYGDKSLRALRPHTWDSLTENIKSATSIILFNGFIKNWFKPKCKCDLPLDSLTAYRIITKL